MSQEEFDTFLDQHGLIDIEVCKKWKNFKPTTWNFRLALIHNDWDLLELLFSKKEIMNDMQHPYKGVMTYGLKCAAEFCAPRSMRWCIYHGANINEDFEGDMLRGVFKSSMESRLHFDLGHCQKLVEKSLKVLLSQNKKWRGDLFAMPDYLLICVVYKKMITKRLSLFFAHSLSMIVGEMLCNDWHKLVYS
jgi:hypothetical protein